MCYRSPRDEYLVAYQKHHRRGIHVWEVRCSAHRNHTIQGLVRCVVGGLVRKYNVWRDMVTKVL